MKSRTLKKRSIIRAREIAKLATFFKKLDAITEECPKVSLKQVMAGLRASHQRMEL